jgi:hypothetical protein
LTSRILILKLEKSFEKRKKFALNLFSSAVAAG